MIQWSARAGVLQSGDGLRTCVSLQIGVADAGLQCCVWMRAVQRWALSSSCVESEKPSSAGAARHDAPPDCSVSAGPPREGMRMFVVNSGARELFSRLPNETPTATRTMIHAWLRNCARARQRVHGIAGRWGAHGTAVRERAEPALRGAARLEEHDEHDRARGVERRALGEHLDGPQRPATMDEAPDDHARDEDVEGRGEHVERGRERAHGREPQPPAELGGQRREVHGDAGREDRVEDERGERDHRAPAVADHVRAVQLPACASAEEAAAARGAGQTHHEGVAAEELGRREHVLEDVARAPERLAARGGRGEHGHLDDDELDAARRAPEPEHGDGEHRARVPEHDAPDRALRAREEAQRERGKHDVHACQPASVK
jgi:hypothetical protein